MTTFKQGALAAALAASAFGFPASADDRQDRFRTELSGFNEVHFSGGNHVGTPPTAASLVGAISTGARGRFRAEIDDRAQAIDYVLDYEGLEGTVAQAHIHFGQKHTVGGIVAWLCQGTVRAPAQVASTPECPQSGTVTRNHTAGHGAGGRPRVRDYRRPFPRACSRDSRRRHVRQRALFEISRPARFGASSSRGDMATTTIE